MSPSPARPPRDATRPPSPPSDGTPPDPPTCPRLDALDGRELPGGLRLAQATGRLARMRGLARLDGMPRSAGLHIPGCRSVHTFTMRFALDLIWLGRDGEVVRVDRDVPPRRMKACRRARSVVEVNAGTADAFLASGGL